MVPTYLSFSKSFSFKCTKLSGSIYQAGFSKGKVGSSLKMSSLFTPFKFGGIGEIQNRIVLAPMTRCRASENGVPQEMVSKYYVQRASAGLLTSEGVHISPEAIGFLNCPGIFTQEQINGWKKVTSEVHDNGGKIVIQLWHQGRQSHSDFHNGELPVSASAIPVQGDQIYVQGGIKKPYETPRPLRLDEMPRIVSDYQNAARNAKEAGFDGVELHGANGYLLDQFMQSKSNTRLDFYGGSVENRFRLVGEVIEGVLQEWSPDQVGIRFSPNGVYGDMGSADNVETFSYAIEKVAEYRLGFVDLVDGLAFGFHNLCEPFTLKMAVDIVEKVQGNSRVTAIIGNCGYTKELAEERVKNGEADLIAFGRPFISSPDLVDRFKTGAPLNPAAEMSAWYTNTAEGYTSFPSLPK